MENIKFRAGLLLILFIIISNISGEVSESTFSSGQRMFMENKPENAIIWLELALKEDPRNRDIYNYLGISYEQIGENKKAIDTYKRGLTHAGNLKSLFFTNIANNMGILGDYDSAINFYTKAIGLGYYGDAIRNRAGEYLRKQQYNEALKDYKLYLLSEVDPYQGHLIKKVVSLLENKLNEIAIQKIEEERKRLEEEERQKVLLSNVLNSLSSVGNETTNLSAGTETVEGYNDDFDIVD